MSDNPVQQAVALIKEGDPRQARSVLVEHLKANPEDAKAWALLARIVNEPSYKEELLKRVLALPDDGSGVYEWASKEISELRFSDQPAFDPEVTQAASATQELPPAYEEETEPPPTPEEDTQPADRPFAGITQQGPPTVDPTDETQAIERTTRLPRSEIDRVVSEGKPTEPQTTPDFDEPERRRLPLGLIAALVVIVLGAGVTFLVLLGGGAAGVANLLSTPTPTPEPTPTLAPTQAPALPTDIPPTLTPTATLPPSPTPEPRLSVSEATTRLLEAPEGLSAFGQGITLTERNLLVGAVEGDGEESQPVVLVYTVTGESLTEEALLPYNGLGFAAAGDRIAVTTDAGLALYERSEEEGWQQVTTIEEEVAEGLIYGASIALAGDVLAVGAPAEDDSQPGVVYVYQPDALGEWGQVATLQSENDSDGYGAQVVTNGQTIAVGAFDAETPAGVASGMVYVYVIEGENWLLRTLLYEEDGTGGDQFGAALALNDRTLTVGVPRPVGERVGRLVIYDDLRGQAEWEQVDPVTLEAPNTGDPAGFARRVAVADEVVITTAPLDADAVLVYLERSNVWRLDRALTSTGDVLYVPAAGPLATNGGLIAVVAPDVLGGPPAILLFTLAEG